MLKKTITFEDVDGNEITEDFWFNVSRADLIELLLEKPELEQRFMNMAENLTEAIDGKTIMGLIRDFIFLSVGKREEGGRKFVKNQSITDDFRYSGAYDSLFWELVNDPPLANNFMEGIIPKSLLEEIQSRGGVEKLQKQTRGETVVQLPDKDWAVQPAPENPAFTELPESGRIDTVEGQVVTGAEPTPFPQSLTQAVETNRQSQINNSVISEPEEDQPKWMQENRLPTKKEMMAMPKDELQLAMKMKAAGVFQ